MEGMGKLKYHLNVKFQVKIPFSHFFLRKDLHSNLANNCFFFLKQHYLVVACVGREYLFLL